MTDLAANATTAAFEGDLPYLATYSGEFETFDDADWKRVTLQASTSYQFFGSAEGPGANAGDSQMTLHNSAGVQVAFNDGQSGGTLNSGFVYTAPTGRTYFVKMNASIPASPTKFPTRSVALDTGWPEFFTDAVGKRRAHYAAILTQYRRRHFRRHLALIFAPRHKVRLLGRRGRLDRMLVALRSVTRNQFTLKEKMK